MPSQKLKRKRQRGQRRKKLRRLRQKLTETRSVGDRQRLIDQIRRISPGVLISDK
jgi:hypothetical protein